MFSVFYHTSKSRISFYLYFYKISIIFSFRIFLFRFVFHFLRLAISFEKRLPPSTNSRIAFQFGLLHISTILVMSHSLRLFCSLSSVLGDSIFLSARPRLSIVFASLVTLCRSGLLDSITYCQIFHLFANSQTLKQRRRAKCFLEKMHFYFSGYEMKYIHAFIHTHKVHCY